MINCVLSPTFGRHDVFVLYVLDTFNDLYSSPLGISVRICIQKLAEEYLYLLHH